MVEDYRFWLALVLYFLGSTFSSFILSLIRKKRFLQEMIFLVLMLMSTVGLWMSLNGGFNDFIILTRTNGVVLVLGLLCGLIPFTFPLLIILPLIISFSLKIPLKNLQAQDHRILGELQFYPSNEGSVTLEWISEEGQEHIVQLKGEKAALVFVKRDAIKEYFFLKSVIEPIGILSRSVNNPLSALPQENTEWFYNLRTEAMPDTKAYKDTYPALKFLTPGFFTNWSYQYNDEQLWVIRK